jgi:hypothetical protein
VKHWTLFYCDRHGMYHLTPGTRTVEHCALSGLTMRLVDRSWTRDDILSRDELEKIRVDLVHARDIPDHDVIITGVG